MVHLFFILFLLLFGDFGHEFVYDQIYAEILA